MHTSGVQFQPTLSTVCRPTQSQDQTPGFASAVCIIHARTRARACVCLCEGANVNRVDVFWLALGERCVHMRYEYAMWLNSVIGVAATLAATCRRFPGTENTCFVVHYTPGKQCKFNPYPGGRQSLGRLKCACTNTHAHTHICLLESICGWVVVFLCVGWFLLSEFGPTHTTGVITSVQKCIKLCILCAVCRKYLWIFEY